MSREYVSIEDIKDDISVYKLNQYCDREYSRKWRRRQELDYQKRHCKDKYEQRDVLKLQEEYAEILDKPFKEQLQIVMSGEFHKPLKPKRQRRSRKRNDK